MAIFANLKEETSRENACTEPSILNGAPLFIAAELPQPAQGQVRHRLLLFEGRCCGDEWPRAKAATSRTDHETAVA
jgi:hypothetical protein